jgi:hypothetical protein
VPAQLAVEFTDEFIEEKINTKFLGMTVNNLNWKNHIDQTLPKFDDACFAVRRLFHTLNINVLRMVCFAYFPSINKHGVILGGFNQFISCIYIIIENNWNCVVYQLQAHVEAYFKNLIFYLYHICIFFH